VKPGVFATLILNKEGYEIFNASNFTLDYSDSYPIGLSKQDVSDPCINKVLLQGTGRWIAFSSDIMVSEVSCKSNTTMKVNITIQANLGGEIASNYVIKQNRSVVLKNETGKFFNIDMSLFKPGAKIVAYIEFNDGTKSKEVELLIRNYKVIR